MTRTGSVGNLRLRNRRFVCVLAVFLSVLNGLGCKALQRKHDNPVMMEAPRRVKNVVPDEGTQVAQGAEQTSDGKVTQTGITNPDGGKPPGGRLSGKPPLYTDPWANWEDDTAIYNSKVAATVNGAPILNGDVLDKFSLYLIGVREDMQKKRLTSEDFFNYREMLVQKLLRQHIERRVLIESMRSSMKPEQVKMMNTQLESMFDKDEVKKRKDEFKVSTRTELELELNKKGTTLQNVKDSFITEQMAMGYYQHKIGKPHFVDRLDLLAYYQAHADEYAIPKKVEWEQIQIRFRDATTKSKDDARERMQTALRELATGTPFDAVARKYSEGATAKEGGQWEAMEAGTLADAKLEELLFEMPIGKLSDIYEGAVELQVVRVHSRQEAGRVPLGDVQDDIRKKLEQEQLSKRSKDLIKKLWEDAVIETKYDMPDSMQFPAQPGGAAQPTQP